MREIDPLVTEYQHDKQRPREAEALLTLRKVASLVRPIMRQRNWKVGTLAEFYPPERNLLGLNINRGQKICLRLRYPSDERQFIPLEQVVDTMLHELCHIVHGPHNNDFHALWNQLRDEHEALIRKGYTGEGFLSEGRRLGGRKIPLDEARRLARNAAERRRTLGGADSGQKLGGAPILGGTDIRKVIAAAAQRRIDVTKGCASGTSDGERLAEESNYNGFRTKADEDDANERAIMQAYIELIQEEERERYGNSYIPPSQENPAGSRGVLPPSSPSPPPLPVHSKPGAGDAPENHLPSSESVYESSGNAVYDAVWACTVCTLENPPSFLCCDACGTERTLPPSKSRSNSKQMGRMVDGKVSKPVSRLASQSSSTGTRVLKPRTRAIESLAALERNAPERPLGWLCHVCGSFMETEWWTCSNCGVMKQQS